MVFFDGARKKVSNFLLRWTPIGIELKKLYFHILWDIVVPWPNFTVFNMYFLSLDFW